ncbi:MAG: hypothetical protein L7H18_05800 [Candidatus Nealsonbacteria bacterium DGGOD1a]|nr:MAG: hypothetical protein L7H18_05800 [Candidatus Nealsonbacteria bacterium DGGOD1a]
MIKGAKLLKDLIIVECVIFLCGMVCRFALFPLIFRVDGNAFYFKTIGLSLIWGAAIALVLLVLGLFLSKKTSRLAWLAIIPLGGVAVVTAIEANYLYNRKYLSTTDFLPYLFSGTFSAVEVGWPVLQYAPYVALAGIALFAWWYEGRE